MLKDEKLPLAARLRHAFLKPPKPGTGQSTNAPQSIEELDSLVKRASDKERLIGLLAAPWAAGIGLLITSALIANDPAPFLKNGQQNHLHVSVTLYHEVMGALIVLSVLMLAMAWLRKRLILGMVMALYGLAVFNLRYWGFGIPFVFGAAWYLVRSYRLQRDLREARGDAPWRPGAQTSSANTRRPRASKRYTPPTSR